MLAALVVYALGLPLTRAWFVDSINIVPAVITSGYAPVADDLEVRWDGTLRIDKRVTSYYNWSDPDGIDSKVNALYQWCWVDPDTNVWHEIESTEVDNKATTDSNYYLTQHDKYKYIGVKITPRADGGFTTGEETLSSIYGPVQMLWTLSYSEYPSDTGSITVTPPKHEDSYGYLEGTEVTLHANPDEWYDFDYWTVNGALWPNNVVTMDRDIEAVANFAIKRFTLTVAVEGNGKIVLVNKDLSETELEQGTHTYDALTDIPPLRAYADDGYEFVAWTLNPPGLDVSSGFNMKGNYSVAAEFRESSYSVTIGSVFWGTATKDGFPFSIIVSRTDGGYVAPDTVKLTFDPNLFNTNPAAASQDGNNVVISGVLKKNKTGSLIVTVGELTEARALNPTPTALDPDPDKSGTSFSELGSFGSQGDSHEKEPDGVPDPNGGDGTGAGNLGDEDQADDTAPIVGDGDLGDGDQTDNPEEGQ